MTAQPGQSAISLGTTRFSILLSLPSQLLRLLSVLQSHLVHHLDPDLGLVLVPLEILTDAKVHLLQDHAEADGLVDVADGVVENLCPIVEVEVDERVGKEGNMTNNLLGQWENLVLVDGGILPYVVPYLGEQL